MFMKSWIFWILGLILFEGVAEYYGKVLQVTKEWKFYWVSLFFYIVCNMCWLVALRNGVGLVQGHFIFVTGSTLGTFFIGLVLFKETLSVYQIVGVALACVSLVLLLIEN